MLERYTIRVKEPFQECPPHVVKKTIAEKDPNGDWIHDPDRRMEKLEAFKSAILGWRENDWPEGFCRMTAELLADRGREELLEGSDKERDWLV